MLYFLGNDQPISGPMPRKPRFFLPGVPVHVVQRGNNRQPIFFDDVDYRAYLDWLKEGSERWSCRIHAYVLMTNHVHLLLTSDDADGVSPRGKGSEPEVSPQIRPPRGHTASSASWSVDIH